MRGVWRYAIVAVVGVGVGFGAAHVEEAVRPDPVPVGAEETSLQAAKKTCGAVFAVLGDNGHALSLTADSGQSQATSMIEYDCLARELAMPDAVLSRVRNTRALDGVQEAQWGAFTASWTYHPDDGLNMVISQR